MPDLASPWLLWALLSALFAALTAIFAKVGVENINSDLATFIWTIVVLVVLGAILAARGLFQPIASIAGGTFLFLTLSGLCTGRRGSATSVPYSWGMPHVLHRSTNLVLFWLQPSGFSFLESI